MKYDEKLRRFILASGRDLGSCNTILGLGLEGDYDERPEFHNGYDGPFHEDIEIDEDENGIVPFTAAERQEIAEYMIERWKRWAVRFSPAEPR